SFFYSYRITLLFLFLQGITFLLIYQNNRYQRLVWLSSANQVTGSVLSLQNQFEDYTKLDDINDSLSYVNAILQKQIEDFKAQIPITELDSSRQGSFDFYPVKVIQSTTRFAQNSVTIDRGSKHGVRSRMALITDKGIIGRVDDVSENFATVLPIISTRKGAGAFVRSKGGTTGFKTRWQGEDYRYINLSYVMRSAQVQVGDTIVTSGEDEIYPKDYPVGVVVEVNRESTDSQLDVKVELFVDFGQIDYAYVIENHMKPELDSLKVVSEGGENE
ncbi:MAG: rod shape-determining protein MreC, partial [Bacteroidota bacterium]